MYGDLIALIVFSDIFNFSNLISIKISSSCLYILVYQYLVNESITLLSMRNKFSKSITLFIINSSVSSIIFSLNSISSLILKSLSQIFIHTLS